MEEQQDTSTATKAQCTECGTEVPPDAPLGLCPACLLKRAMLATTAGLNRPSVGGAFEPPAVEQLVPLFPHLEVIELVGRGGMGAVYKARQIHLDRFVAIKILPTTIADDPAFAERFAREARSLARLNHANIVTVHDFGRAGPYFYFVMEYVDGANLRQALLTKSLEPQQALAIVPQICDALQYAHDEGIVHRDIKPENVLLDKKGRVKIADFGLAKLLQKTPQNYTLTQTHVTMGTPQYMAPEQTERPTEVDHRADIYSLGVVFYEMLTGELPLGRFAAPSQKAPVDARLDDVVFKTLEKEPARRYQHASEVKTSVQELSNAPTKASPMPTPRPASPNDAQLVLPYAGPNDTVQHSRTAWVGAILGVAGVAALTLVVLLITTTGAAAIVLGVLPLLFAIAALLAMPLCGLLAISQIHRAQGALGSLRLALFDAIAVPMFILNAIPLLLFARMLDGFSRISAGESLLVVAVMGLPVFVIADIFVTRYLWRRVSAGLPQSSLGYFTPRPSAAPKKADAAVSGITYQGPGRFSRTAIAGAVWGSLAVLGPACLLVGSVAIPGMRGASGANTIVLTGKNFTLTTPASPSPPRSPGIPPLASPLRGIVPSTRPAIIAPAQPNVPVAPGGASKSGGGGGFGGSGGFGSDANRAGRRKPTTTPAKLNETTLEGIFEKKFEMELKQATTQAVESTFIFQNATPTTLPFMTIDPLATSSGRTGSGTVTFGGGGGGFGGTVSVRNGTVTSSSGSNPFAPVFTTTPVSNTQSFWSSVNNVARGLVFPVLALAISGPIGATILGIIAISQIRRSNGALYGMPLAVADALFFPLLIIDGLIVAIVIGLFMATASARSQDPMVPPLTAATVAAALLLDWWIWRRAVRAAGAP